jgi:hypothetical protein
MRAAAVVLLAACATEQIRVTPHELLRHAHEFRDEGHAVVDVRPEGTAELSTDRAFDVTVGGKPVHLTIRDMVQDCPDVIPFAGTHPASARDCLLIGTSVQSFTLATHRHVPWGTIGEVALGVTGAVLVVAAFGLAFGLVCPHSTSGC